MTNTQKPSEEIGNIWGTHLSDEMKSNINKILVRYKNAKTIKRAWQNEKEMYKLVAQAIQATREETVRKIEKNIYGYEILVKDPYGKGFLVYKKHIVTRALKAQKKGI